MEIEDHGTYSYLLRSNCPFCLSRKISGLINLLLANLIRLQYIAAILSQEVTLGEIEFAKKIIPNFSI
jgi:hypothetical protein